MVKRRMRIAQFLVAGALTAGLALMGTGSTRAAGFAGHWKVTLSARCANSPQNAKVCSVVFGGLKGTGARGTIFTEQLSVTVNVAANGHYTAAGSGKLTERATGAKVHGCPSVKSFGRVLFTGTCTIVQTYKGHIANDPRGFPVFYGETYTLTFNGKYLGGFKDTNSGLPSPARVGTYGSAWAAHLAGLKSVPPGFSFISVVSR